MRRLAGSAKTLSRGALHRGALSEGRSSWRAPSREAGALTLSYVIIVPVFLIGIMTVVQASIWYLARDSVLAAARHGADVARTSQPPPGSGAQAAISFATSATSALPQQCDGQRQGHDQDDGQDYGERADSFVRARSAIRRP